MVLCVSGGYGVLRHVRARASHIDRVGLPNREQQAPSVCFSSRQILHPLGRVACSCVPDSPGKQLISRSFALSHSDFRRALALVRVSMAEVRKVSDMRTFDDLCSTFGYKYDVSLKISVDQPSLGGSSLYTYLLAGREECERMETRL